MTRKKPSRPTIFLRGSGANRASAPAFVFAYIGDAGCAFEYNGRVDTGRLEEGGALADGAVDAPVDRCTDPVLSACGVLNRTESLNRMEAMPDPNPAAGNRLDGALDVTLDPSAGEAPDANPRAHPDGLRPRSLRRRYAPANTRALVARARLN